MKTRNHSIITKTYRRNILEMLAEGDRPCQIARDLKKSPTNIAQTIKLMRKLCGARSTVQLVVMYRENNVPVNFPFKEKR